MTLITSGLMPSLPALCRTAGEGEAKSTRQRIGPKLELHHLAGLPFTALDVERRAAGVSGPHAPPLPADGWIVDTAVHAFGVEAHGIRHAQCDKLSIHQRFQ